LNDKDGDKVSKNKQTAIVPIREDNYAEWYQQGQVTVGIHPFGKRGTDNCFAGGTHNIGLG